MADLERGEHRHPPRYVVVTLERSLKPYAPSVPLRVKLGKECDPRRVNKFCRGDIEIMFKFMAFVRKPLVSPTTPSFFSSVFKIVELLNVFYVRPIGC